MTAIAIWLTKEAESTIYAVGDTRYTSLSDPKQITSNNAPKMFEITVKCSDSSSEPSLQPHSTFSFGLAFAGSVSIASNTLSYIQVIFSKLECKKGVLPSLKALSNKVLKVLKYYIGCAYNMENNHKSVEIGIFGYCEESEKLKIFHIKNCNPDIIEIPDDDFLLLGSKIKEIREQINQNKKKYPSCVDLEPGLTIKDIVERKGKDEQYKTIGGGLQIMTVNKLYIQHHFIVDLLSDEDSECKLMEIGLNDIGGDCISCGVSINHVAFNFNRNLCLQIGLIKSKI